MQKLQLQEWAQTRFPGLDLLKSIAIICVILNHTLPQEGVIIKLLYHYGIYMAVPVFMVVSGFLMCHVWKRHHILGIKDYFSVPRFFNRLKGYVIPYIIYLFFECLCLHNFNFSFLCKMFITGGFGAGSYFAPVFFQFLVLFPFLYKLARFPQVGTLVILVITLFYETWIAKMLGEGLYRLIFLRYLLLCWCGILLYRYQINYRLICKWCLLSLLYVTIVYCRFSPPFVYSWFLTSWMVSGYALWIVWAFLHIQNVPFVLKKINIGRQTWFIYLFQIIYLWRLNSWFPTVIQPKWVQTALGCCIGGVLFFYAYQWSATCLKAGIHLFKRQIKKGRC